MRSKKGRIIFSVIADLMIVWMTGSSVWKMAGGDLRNMDKVLRYFTMDSNIFCAFTALLLAVNGVVLLIFGRERFSKTLLLLKYIGTVAVMVTFMTVVLYLGSVYGYKEILFAETNLYMHLMGPLLALVSFTAFERGIRLSPAHSALGLLPVLLYGGVYTGQVLVRKGWPDFYHFNTDGHWYVAMVLMLLLTAALSFLVRVLHNLCDRETDHEKE